MITDALLYFQKIVSSLNTFQIILFFFFLTKLILAEWKTENFSIRSGHV